MTRLRPPLSILLFGFMLHAMAVDPPSRGLVLWLKADGAFELDRNNHVKMWRDVSGHGNDAEQCRSSKFRPKWIPDAVPERGLPAVRFDGRANFLLVKRISELDDRRELTWFVVFRQRRLSGNTHLISSAYDKGAKRFSLDMWGVRCVGDDLFSYARDQRGRRRSVSFESDDRWHLLVTEWTSGSLLAGAWDEGGFIQKQGADASPGRHLWTSIGADFPAGLDDKEPFRDPEKPEKPEKKSTQSETKGCSLRYGFDGDVGEVLVYDRTLSFEEMRQVRKHLLERWFSTVDPDDSDNDGLSDAWELEHFGNLEQDGSGDFDNDGLSNSQEYHLGTNPTQTDSDKDGMPDRYEADQGFDPLTPDGSSDADADGISNLHEMLLDIDPRRSAMPDNENTLELEAYIR